MAEQESKVEITAQDRIFIEQTKNTILDLEAIAGDMGMTNARGRVHSRIKHYKDMLRRYQDDLGIPRTFIS